MLIYSEFGIEQVDSLEDVEAAKTVCAVLAPGITHPPACPEDVTHVYCPCCLWLTPDAVHENGCPLEGIVYY